MAVECRCINAVDREGCPPPLLQGWTQNTSDLHDKQALTLAHMSNMWQSPSCRPSLVSSICWLMSSLFDASAPNSSQTISTIRTSSQAPHQVPSSPIAYIENMYRYPPIKININIGKYRRGDKESTLHKNDSLKQLALCWRHGLPWSWWEVWLTN